MELWESEELLYTGTSGTNGWNCAGNQRNCGNQGNCGNLLSDPACLLAAFSGIHHTREIESNLAQDATIPVWNYQSEIRIVGTSGTVEIVVTKEIVGTSGTVRIWGIIVHWNQWNQWMELCRKPEKLWEPGELWKLAIRSCLPASSLFRYPSYKGNRIEFGPGCHNTSLKLPRERNFGIFELHNNFTYFLAYCFLLNSYYK